MSGDPPPDAFGDVPFLGELMRMLSGHAGSSSDTARQLAHTIANEGATEPNIDPTERLAVEQLIRVAELQVAAVTGLTVGHRGAVSVEVGNRAQWADRTIADYRPLFETLAGAMTQRMQLPNDLPTGDPMAAMMAGMGQLMGPMMLGVTTGSMVGHLAHRAHGGHDLPVPRPEGAPILVLLRNVDEFGRDWSLDPGDLRLWVCLHEVATQSVINVPHVRARLTDLLDRHAAAFDPDPGRLADRFGDLDLGAGPEALARIQSELGDPELVLGAVRSAGQDAVQPELTALVATITGYVDRTMDTIGETLIGSYPMITEAMRRRRVEADASDRFVERILGLELDADQYDRGTAFAAGVVQRAGIDGLNRLFTEPEALPTPAEVDAPGLWLARIDLPS